MHLGGHTTDMVPAHKINANLPFLLPTENVTFRCQCGNIGKHSVMLQMKGSWEHFYPSQREPYLQIAQRTRKPTFSYMSFNALPRHQCVVEPILWYGTYQCSRFGIWKILVYLVCVVSNVLNCEASSRKVRDGILPYWHLISTLKIVFSFTKILCLAKFIVNCLCSVTNTKCKRNIVCQTRSSRFYCSWQNFIMEMLGCRIYEMWMN